MKLETLLEKGNPIIADGGMGTMLFGLGLVQGSSPELWNVEHPDKVRQVHREYIQAGAQIILTNSFGGNRARLEGHHLAERGAELNEAAARVARQEADAADHPVIVAGSMGPLGQFLEPMGDLTEEQATAIFAEQARALIAGGVDVLWIETMADLNEVKAAVAGCRTVDAHISIVTTLTFDTKGRTMMGVTPEKAVQTLSGLGVIALGANCGNGPDELETVIAHMHETNPQAILIAKANAGVPQVENGQTVYRAGPDEMAAYAHQVRDCGATIIGACCGSTPAHIKAIANALSGK
jgi:5-methyltetrahydrofolate--homocysteine methyltransferase